jgi:hypothetical protein
MFLRFVPAVGLVVGSLLATTPAVADRRDHRSNRSEPKVRDHRSEPSVRDHRSKPSSSTHVNAPTPRVRDHRHDAEADVYVYDDSPRVSARYVRPRLPLVMLPFKLDIGAASASTSRGLAGGIGGSLGIHWASLAPRPTDTDVGIGIFGSVMSARDVPEIMESNNEINQYGMYLEVGRTLSRGRLARTWASGRAEYLQSRAFRGDNHYGFGTSARLSAELYASTSGAHRSGVVHGTWALGVYAEVAIRDTALDAGKLYGGVGMTIRTPLLFSF